MEYDNGPCFFFSEDMIIFSKEGKEETAIEKVRAYFRERWIEERVQELDVSSATVELAAAALHCFSLTFIFFRKNSWNSFQEWVVKIGRRDYNEEKVSLSGTFRYFSIYEVNREVSRKQEVR